MGTPTGFASTSAGLGALIRPAVSLALPPMRDVSVPEMSGPGPVMSGTDTARADVCPAQGQKQRDETATAGSWPRHGRKGRSFVPRNEQRPCFGNPRPWRHLHDGDDGAGAGAGAHLTQPLAQAGVDLVAHRLDELELLARRL